MIKLENWEIFTIIFGATLKIIDDYYDEKLY